MTMNQEVALLLCHFRAGTWFISRLNLRVTFFLFAHLPTLHERVSLDVEDRMDDIFFIPDFEHHSFVYMSLYVMSYLSCF